VTVDDFTAWYRLALDEIGVPLRPEDIGSDTEETELPNALRAWYRVAGNSPLNSAHNRILTPDRLRRIDDKVAFAEENRESVFWAYDAASAADDPLVWQGQPVGEHPVAWYSEELPLSRFIIEMLVHTVPTD
jgi:hypothetical protein